MTDNQPQMGLRAGQLAINDEGKAEDVRPAIPIMLDGGIDGPAQHLKTAVSKREIRNYNLAFSATCFGIGTVFGSATTYMVYQIQQIAYTSVGHNPDMPPGSGCLSLELPCRVPFGSRDVNLTSLFLFLNAISFGVSGALTLLICGWGDYLPFKREQYISFTILYGILALPAAGLTEYTLHNYTALIGLYVSFNIIGFMAGAWQNIFVPYTMQIAAPSPTTIVATAASSELSDTQVALAPAGHVPDMETDESRRVRETEGVKISVAGNSALNIGMAIFFLITIGLAHANAHASMYAGLYMTTTAGGICILLAGAGWRFLPNPKDVKKRAEGEGWLMVPLNTFIDLFKGIWKYPEAFKFLLAWTIYNDSIFAFSAVTGNLFNLIIRPSLVEYTCYSLTGTLSQIIGSMLFYFLFPRTSLTLRQWSILSYAIPSVVCLWCMFGLNSNSPIGFKHRAEFYVGQVLVNLATAVLTCLFRVLFSELFQKGDEVKYFGFQLVLSLGTVWIPQVVDGPIVDKTNNQRLPAIVAFVFFLSAIGLAWWTDDRKGIRTVLLVRS
ncbi:hypothetical protein I302_100019 [Kwoniella bestiolae CBS 10118]|uniref:Autophagy-related protein n=1 Tax=Kwoniella bestiolae CBS 10118 TaxID=1296100 RepID=A0A1B9G401_9TREE|nr:hypothetical protein I302_03391 [Kwoniella bestiolae CBS 10118]OCF25718.1 hypothetical protein I302_03391 [Kwoniella bestiolae CBS 10118]